MKQQVVVLLLATCALSTNAFLSPAQQPLQIRASDRYLRDDVISPRRQRGVSANLFGDFFKKLKGDKTNDDDKDDKIQASDKSEAPEKTKTSESAVDSSSFFVQSTGSAAAPTPDPEETPQRRAERLKAQAARIRLEVEKGQVQLTLEKISKLDAKLNNIKEKDDVNVKQKDELEEALLALKSQLVTDGNGDVRFVVSQPSSQPIENGPQKIDSEDNDDIIAASSVPLDKKLNAVEETMEIPLAEEELQAITANFNKSPEFLRLMLAKIAGFTVDPEAVVKSNATDIISQFYRDEQQIQQQTSFMSTKISDARDMVERAYENSEDMEPPMPSQAAIDRKVKELSNLPMFFKKGITGTTNDTEIAIDLLKDEWSRETDNLRGGGNKRNMLNLFGRGSREMIGQDGERMDKEDAGTFSRLFSEDESTSAMVKDDLSLLMESTFPSSTRKEGGAPSEKEVNAFVNDILVPTKAFVPTGNPLPVPGGWIIRGKNKCKDGDDLINNLDRRIVNFAGLKGSISYFLIKDPYPPTEEEFMDDPLNWPQVLFLAGPNIARDPRPVIGTLITALGISTTWYASIYAFMTNTKVFERVEETMSLADSGMPVDMSWLTELSIPLFLSFVALQLLHETAHLAVAKSKKFEVTVPTLVPSIISGITGTITSFKTSPKNKSDLLLFSVSGPLTGMICSLLVEMYGLVLTASADMESLQSFPGLPLALLRQSSLGGGLIDLILGNGVLNVPSSVEGANMLASTIIPLHPLAISGFLSLMVNALALVPAGRTDGGRISMSLFGRSGSQGLTLFSLAVLFVVGLTGSDLLLFYFGFIVLAQLELEIPLRNEIDDVDLTGVLLASMAGFLSILTLVPM